MLTADGTRTTPYRLTITPEMRVAHAEFGDHARAHGARWRELKTDLGLHEDDQVDASFEYRPGEEIDDRDDLFTMRFLYAFWRLCSQGIAQLDDVPAGHNARLLAERAGVSPDVRVTTIRPTTRSPDQPGMAPKAVASKPTDTAIIRHVAERVAAGEAEPELILAGYMLGWRDSSGNAHGLRWTAMRRSAEVTNDCDGRPHYRASADIDKIVATAGRVHILTCRAVDLYDQRRRSPAG